MFFQYQSNHYNDQHPKVVIQIFFTVLSPMKKKVLYFSLKKRCRFCILQDKIIIFVTNNMMFVNEY